MLPIGSVVYLAEGDRKVMIVNRGALAEQDGVQVIFDYTGTMYPQGLDMKHVFYFNEENIDTIVFEGLKDEEEERFLVLYEQWLAKHPELKKGDAKKKKS